MFHYARWPGVILLFTPVNMFVLFYSLDCEFFFCVLCCLMFINMFHIEMQLMQRLDQWNEYVCVCIYIYIHIYIYIYVCVCLYVSSCLTEENHRTTFWRRSLTRNCIILLFKVCICWLLHWMKENARLWVIKLSWCWQPSSYGVLLYGMEKITKKIVELCIQ